MIRVLFLFAFLLVGGGVQAAQCTMYQAQFGTATGSWQMSPEPACSEAVGMVSSAQPGALCYGVPCTYTSEYLGGACTVIRGGATSYTINIAEKIEPNCNVCSGKAGTTAVKNFTRGYSSVPPKEGGVARLDFLPSGARNTGGVPDMPAAMCIDGCMATIGPAQQTWQSDQPTPNGLYRASTDHETTATETECTAGPAETDMSDPTKAAPGCNGSEGYLNGRKVCIPNTDVNTVQSIGGNATQGNPPAGSGGELDDIPQTGGDGGNKGGPPGPGDGRTFTSNGTVIDGTNTGVPDGTTDKPGDGKEQAACGAPGQPKCKIDEAGTPNGQGIFTKAEADLATGIQSAKDAITGHQSLQSPAWTWSFQLPSGCSPISVPAFALSLDVCQFQPMIHNILGPLWIMAGLFFGIRKVGSTMEAT